MMFCNKGLKIEKLFILLKKINFCYYQMSILATLILTLKTMGSWDQPSSLSNKKLSMRSKKIQAHLKVKYHLTMKLYCIKKSNLIVLQVLSISKSYWNMFTLTSMPKDLMSWFLLPFQWVFSLKIRERSVRKCALNLPKKNLENM